MGGSLRRSCSKCGANLKCERRTWLVRSQALYPTRGNWRNCSWDKTQRVVRALRPIWLTTRFVGQTPRFRQWTMESRVRTWHIVFRLQPRGADFVNAAIESRNNGIYKNMLVRRCRQLNVLNSWRNKLRSGTLVSKRKCVFTSRIGNRRVNLLFSPDLPNEALYIEGPRHQSVICLEPNCIHAHCYRHACKMAIAFTTLCTEQCEQPPYQNSTRNPPTIQWRHGASRIVHHHSRSSSNLPFWCMEKPPRSMLALLYLLYISMFKVDSIQPQCELKWKNITLSREQISWQVTE